MPDEKMVMPGDMVGGVTPKVDGVRRKLVMTGGWLVVPLQEFEFPCLWLALRFFFFPRDGGEPGFKADSRLPVHMFRLNSFLF
ncbi:MAG: hypothetical protein ACM3SY_18145 [Candidatus Omnitrophota bacterium]